MFGRLRLRPTEFYDMSMSETQDMLAGWHDNLEYHQYVARKVSIVISEVTSKVMGGKGTDKAIRSMWPLSIDSPDSNVLLDKLAEKKKTLPKRKKVKHNGSASKS